MAFCDIAPASSDFLDLPPLEGAGDAADIAPRVPVYWWLLAVLLGWLPRCEYKNHGPDHHKGFSLEDQGATFFVRVFAKDQPVRAVPMIPEEAFPVAALVLRQLQAATPGLEGAALLAVLQGTVGRMKPAGGRGS